MTAMAGQTALIVVDVLNTYEHEDAELLTESVAEAVGPMSDLLSRATDQNARIIYVNDNYGDWNSSQEELTQRALAGARPDLVEPVLPPDEVDFILKARHTIFYMTPFEYLLGQRSVERLVLVGQVTEQCILYSALDAYVRHIPVTIPTDAVAHIDETLAGAALEMMRRNMDAQLVKSDDVQWED
jgi:nicotinamidase-related amidase